MANVVYSADIMDMRGKIGNKVYTKARNGATVRARVSPKNPRSPAQTQARQHFSAASAAYKNLTTAQLATWKAYANTQHKSNAVDGTSYVPSANTVFVGLASKFLQVSPGQPIPTTPPIASFAGDTFTMTATGTVGNINFVPTGDNSPNVKTELLVQPLVSHARTPEATAYRSRGFAVMLHQITFQLPLPPGIYAVAYRFVDILTGQDTGLVTLPIVTVS